MAGGLPAGNRGAWIAPMTGILDGILESDVLAAGWEEGEV